MYSLQAQQEEQLRKLAELTAVHQPALTVGAIEAVEAMDAPAASALVVQGVGSAEEQRLARITVTHARTRTHAHTHTHTHNTHTHTCMCMCM